MDDLMLKNNTDFLLCNTSKFPGVSLQIGEAQVPSPTLLTPTTSLSTPTTSLQQYPTILFPYQPYYLHNSSIHPTSSLPLHSTSPYILPPSNLSLSHPSSCIIVDIHTSKKILHLQSCQ